MIEIPARREYIIEKKIDIKLLDRESSSKTFRGYLNGCLAKVRHDKNKELEVLFEELLRKFNEFYPERIVKNQIEIISGWKGTGSLEIYKSFENDFLIREWIKDKETGEVEERTIEVKKEDVNRMLFIIRSLDLNVQYKCYYIANKLGYDWKELWKERQQYFKIYYYPVKVFEAMKLINYGGRGTITRIK